MIWLRIATISQPEPPLIIMLPFALLLISIALAPMILQHHWELHYHKVCLGLAAVVCGYYFVARHDAERVLHAGLEYFSFIAVVASFFVVSAGIHLRARSHASPAVNTSFLLIGALLANVVGTIGASMLLIRPWIEMNRSRFSGFHLAFFIFVVSNVGGALLPVGPPLFLGYLNNVPFFWPLLRCWPHCLVAIAILLSIFYLIDRCQFSAAKIEAGAAGGAEKWRCFGKRNFVFMSVLLGALIALPPIWREAVMVGCAVTSYYWTPDPVYKANAFTFAPIKEVAWLFFGIFATMIPVLDYVELHARALGVQSDAQFFWATGLFSALLDNAPAYLSFLAGALGLHGLDMNNANQMGEFVAQHGHSLIAVSLGATFFGALTYIGNGPNLLVRAIAQEAKAPTPTFFGFIFKYAAPVLLPIFLLLSLLFFRK
jgi:Na+/H+ antiporter NhaD/arsenite permease-like protein